MEIFQICIFLLQIFSLLNFSSTMKITTFDVNTDQKTVNTKGTYTFIIVLDSQPSVDYRFEVTFDNVMINPDESPTTCQYTLGIINPSTQTLSGCSCTTAGVCSFTLTKTQITDTFLKISYSQVRNPLYVPTSANSPKIYLKAVNTANSADSVSPDNPKTLTGIFQPADISTATLTQESEKVGNANKYIFKFTTINDIPNGGKIKIKIPSEISYSTNPTVQIKIGTGSLSTANFVNPIVEKSLEITLSSTTSAGNIEVHVSNVINPITISSSSNIEITTSISTGELIDKLKATIQAKSTQAALISNVVLEPEPGYVKTVSKETSLSIKLSIEVGFAPGGKLLIEFPSEFNFNTGKFSCVNQLGLVTVSSSSGNCVLNGKTVETNNLYISNPSNGVWLFIRGVINPESTKTTQPFVIKTLDSSNNEICKTSSSFTYNADPGIISFVSGPSRNVNTIGANFVFSLKFQSVSPIPANAKIKIEIPNEQAEFSTNSPTCNKIVSSAKSSLSCTRSIANSVNEVIFTEFCSSSGNPCAADTQFEIEISAGINNPSLLADPITKFVSIKSYIADLSGVIGQTNVNNKAISPNVLPGTIANLIFKRNSPNIVGQLSSYDISFDAPAYLAANNDAILEVSFPQSALYKGTENIECFFFKASEASKACTIESSYSDSSVEKIKVTGFCSGTCNNNEAYILKLKKTRNPLTSATISGKFFLKIKSSSNLIASAQESSNLQGLATTPESIDTTITPSILSTGSNSNYALVFTSKVELATNGKIVISIPVEISLSSGTSCTSEIKESGGTISSISCTIESAQKKITAVSSLSADKFKGSEIKITLSALKNPVSTKPSSNFIIQTETSSGDLVEKGEKSVTMTQASPFTSASVSRSATEINVAVELTITLKVNNPLPANAKILFSLPKEQISISDPNNFAIARISPVATLNKENVASNTDYFTFEITETICPCATDSTIQYKITNGNNPNLVKASSSSFVFRSVSADKSYSYDASASNIFAKPDLSAGPLKSAEIKINSSPIFTGSDLPIKLKLQANNKIPAGGKIYVSFPTNILFPKSVSNAAACKNSANVNHPCTITKATDTKFGEYVQKIVITGICSSECAADTAFDISIEGVLTSYIVTSFSEKIVVSTSTSDDSFIDSSEVSASTLQPNKGIEPEVLKITRADNIVSALSFIEIEIKPRNIVAKGLELKFEIPNDQILMSGSNLICKYYDGSTLSQTTITCPVQSANSKTTFTLPEICSKTNNFCASGTVMKYRVEGFKNPPSVNPSTASTCKFNSYLGTPASISEEKSSSLRLEQEIAPSQLTSVKLELSSKYAADETDLIIEFTTSSLISSGSYLKIENSNSIGYSIGTKCSMGKGNDALKEISVEQTYGTESNGLKPILSWKINGICPSECSSVLFKIHCPMINRIVSEPSIGNLVLTVFASNDWKISQNSIDIANKNLPSVIPYPLLPEHISAIRDGKGPNDNIALNITVTNPFIIVTGSKLTFSLPYNQVKISGNSVNSVLYFGGVSKGTISNVATDVSASKIYNVEFTQTFCNNYCAKNSVITFIVSSLANAATIEFPEIGVNARIHYNSKETSLSKHKAIISPALSLTSSSFLLQSMKGIRESSNLGVLSYVTLSFTLSSSLDAGDIIGIKFPANSLYEKTTPVKIESINDSGTVLKEVTSSSTLKKESDVYGNNFLDTISIANFCPSSCSSGSFVGIKVSLGYNPGVLFQHLDKDLTLLSLASGSTKVVKARGEVLLSKLQKYDIVEFKGTRSLVAPDVAVAITLEFKTPFEIRKSSYFIISFPKVQIINSGNLIVKDAVSTVSEITFSIQSDNSTHFVLRIPEYCAGSNSVCSSNQQFKIEISGLSNPQADYYQVPSNSLRILLYSELKDLYQGSSVGLFINPNVQLKKLENTQISRTTNAAGDEIPYSFSYIVPDGLIPPLNLIIAFPAKMVMKPSFSQCFLVNELAAIVNCELKEANGYMETLTIKDICSISSSCKSSKKVLLTARLKNQGNTFDFRTGKKFILSLKNEQNQDISKGEFSAESLPAITPGTIVTVLSASSSQVGKVSDKMNFTISLKNELLPISQEGLMKITLPEELMKIKPDACDSKYENITLSCKILLNTIQISHNQQQSIKGNISLSLGKIKNPLSTKPTKAIVIETKGKVEGSIVDFDKGSVSYIASQPGNLSSISISRSSSQLNSPSNFAFSFSTGNDIPKGGFLIIDIGNSNQAIISSNVQCFNDSENLSCELLQNTGKVKIPVCKSEICVAPFKFNISIKGLSNPKFSLNNPRNDESFVIQTSTNDDYLIDEEKNNLIALPKLEPFTLEILSFKRGDNEIYGYSVISFEFKIANSILFSDSPFASLEFPQNLFVVPFAEEIICQLNNSNISCTYSKWNSSDSVKRISIKRICNQVQCDSGSVFNITVKGFHNSYYGIHEGNTKLSIDKPINSITNHSMQAINFDIQKYFPSLTPSTFTFLSFQSDNPNPSSVSNLILSIQTLVPLPKMGKIFIDEFYSGLNVQKCGVSNIGNSNSSCKIENQKLIYSWNTSNDIKPSILIITFSIIRNPSSKNNYRDIKLHIANSNNRVIGKSNKNASIAFFEVFSGAKCSKDCEKCTNDPNSCVSCYKHSSKPFLNSQKCYEKCPTGSFEFEGRCEKCYTNCTDCNGGSNNQCFSCNSPLYLLDGKCVASCPNNLIRDSTNKCINRQNCENQCYSCGFSKSYCYSCKPGFSLQGSNCIQKCGDGYYQKAANCEKCPLNCKTCDSKGNCQTCSDLYGKPLLDVSSSKCVETCETSSFKSGNQCKKCHSNCSSCLNETENSCISCKNGEFYYKGTCTRKCPEGYSNTSSYCRQSICSNKNCESCNSTQSSQCLACLPSKPFLIKGDCKANSEICNPFYSYNVTNGNCEKCPYNCKSCTEHTNIVSYCSECENPLSKTPYGCLERCPTGFSTAYSEHRVCKDFSCAFPCEKCAFNASTCFTCVPPMKALDNKCVSNCGDGYFEDSSRICQKCFSDKCDAKVWNQYSWTLVSFALASSAIFVFLLISNFATIAVANTFIALLTPVEFLGKVLMFIIYFEPNIAAATAVLAAIFMNSLAGAAVVFLYFGVFDDHLKPFMKFKSENSKTKKIVDASAFLFGPQILLILVSKAPFIPKNNFDQSIPFMNVMNKVAYLTVAFSLPVIAVDIYTLTSKRDNSDEFNLAIPQLVSTVLLCFSTMVNSLGSYYLKIPLKSNK